MWAWQQTGVEPDLFAFGKKTQVCGFASTHRIDDVDNVFKVSSRINSTWGGNLVDMVRCAQYLEIIEQEGLVDNARVVGAHLLASLRAMAGEFAGTVSNVRGQGLFIAFDLPDKAMRDRTLAACLEHGLIGLASGASADPVPALAGAVEGRSRRRRHQAAPGAHHRGLADLTTQRLEGLAAALADRYRIERELGAGGMATVYLADDLSHGRKVAIKVLRPELAAVIGAERFLARDPHDGQPAASAHPAALRLGRGRRHCSTM